MNEIKMFENDSYVGFRETNDPSYRWIVYIKANGFLQEIYRSWYKTKKFISYFKENDSNHRKMDTF